MVVGIANTGGFTPLPISRAPFVGINIDEPGPSKAYSGDGFYQTNLDRSYVGAQQFNNPDPREPKIAYNSTSESETFEEENLQEPLTNT